MEALQARGFAVTIDRRDLPFGEKWQAELADFIRLSDTVIWLVSEQSVSSKWVNWELDEVAKRNKRLIPVMIGETQRDALPRQLGEIHILPAEGVFSLKRDLDTLVRVLETDRAWLKEASRLQDRAAEWITSGRSSARLLSRGGLAAAELWKDSRPAKAPLPAQEVLDLLHASRTAVARRQRWWIVGSAAVTVFALALAGFAFLKSIGEQRQRHEAEDQRNQAENQRRLSKELREETQKTEFGLLANAAKDRFGDGNNPAGITDAVLLALEALPDAATKTSCPHVAEAEAQLERANRQLRELARLQHDGSVEAASFSPDGSRIVTMSQDRTARVWDVATAKEIARLGHDAVTSAAFSPDSARILTASKDKTARIWDVATGKELARLGHDDAVSSGLFSQDGTLILTASKDKTARIWDVATGKELTRLGHDDAVSLGLFSQDGTRILTATPKTARVWDVATGKELARLGHDDAGILAFSPDGARILTASKHKNKTARIWDVATGKELARLERAERIFGAVFSPDGTRILTASDGGASLQIDTVNGVARVFDAATGKMLLSFTHERRVWAAAFSPDGNSIVTASDDGAARVFSVISGSGAAEEYGCGGPVKTAAFSPDGTRILTISGATAEVFATGANKISPEFRLDNEWGARWVSAAAFSPDGQRIVTATENTAIVWDAATGRKSMELSHDGKVTTAVFSPDGTRLLTASLDQTSRIWDVDAGKELSRSNYDDAIKAAAFGPAGPRLLTVSMDRTARVWDVDVGKVLTSLSFEDEFDEAAFSSDGTRILIVSHDWAHDPPTWTTQMFDVARGREIERLRLEDPFSVAISPDGARFIVAESSKSIVWGTITGAGKVLPKLDIGGASFSPDGARLVTLEGRNALVRDAATGKELATLYHGLSAVSAATFGRDADPCHFRIVTVADGTAYVWRVARSTDCLVQIAKARVTRCLDQADRAQFFLPAPPPIWCITGPGLEAEKDPSKWQPKWPYQSAAWRDWLMAKQRGDEPPLPGDE